MTNSKTISIKPVWFDSRKYLEKSKLTQLQWYGELLIRKSYLDQITAGMDIGKHLKELRSKAFATQGERPIIPEQQLTKILKKDIWSEQGYKSHSARLSTCLDIYNLKIRDDIREECEATPNDDLHLYDTPVDLQYMVDGMPLRRAHLTIDLDAPNEDLIIDIRKVIETLKKDIGYQTERVLTERRDWADSNVLEHIDLYLFEIETGKSFKPAEKIKWLKPNSGEKDQINASRNEKKSALKLLSEEVLQQLKIELYSADNKRDIDRLAALSPKTATS
jgi:hypothetical protein